MPVAQATMPRGIHREAMFWAVLVLAVAIHLPRLTTLTIRGEESRRAVIAREMMETGDWIVPRTQRVVRLSRPPLQNWLIAGFSLLFGEMSAWSIRLPGALSTIATVILVYGVARQKLSTTGAVAAAVSYTTFFQVLEQGRLGETEPIFTLLVAASQLLWYAGWTSGWPRSLVWMVGGTCAGLAMLTKGLQAPLYFFAPVWSYLLLTRQYRALGTRAHLLGWLAFLAVVGAWQVPFTIHMGLHNGWMIYFWNVANRFHDHRVTTFLAHLMTYPFALVLACLAPWSALLLVFTQRQLRAACGDRRDMVIFLALSVLVCFPSVWLPPEARPRYFMPLFPCVALLVGVAVELIREQSLEGRSRWNALVNFFLAGALGSAILLPLTSWLLPDSPYRLPLAESLGTALLLLVLSAGMWWHKRSASYRAMEWQLLTMAAVLGVLYVGPVITIQKQRSENLPAAMAALKHQLPPDVRLVSFDHVHHAFLYYYGQAIPLLSWPQTEADLPAEVEYFCVHWASPQPLQLPFAWEEVASLSVDRNRHAVPKERVVVGRRLSHRDPDLAVVNRPRG